MLVCSGVGVLDMITRSWHVAVQVGIHENTMALSVSGLWKMHCVLVCLDSLCSPPPGSSGQALGCRNSGRVAGHESAESRTQDGRLEE